MQDTCPSFSAAMVGHSEYVHGVKPQNLAMCANWVPHTIAVSKHSCDYWQL